MAAARSAGDGTGVVEEMKETDDGRGEDGEMLAAFEGAKGKDGLLGLDGFRVRERDGGRGGGGGQRNRDTERNRYRDSPREGDRGTGADRIEDGEK